ncbi:hypothetical protein ACRQPR_004126 [Citrobacter amalonaticus]|uniref:hypothetical protein n=1 Tax=Citrobacter farmeri TaxID=67824 RepID=UPI0012EC1436|nr:hypothetical protein [Citrobacter farmeri]MDB2167003.1 hypothetical protein [Citrobacter farmeri]QXA99759.1 hypothetical protein I6L53_23335 [Citrobacter farmeri]
MNKVIYLSTGAAMKRLNNRLTEYGQKVHKNRKGKERDYLGTFCIKDIYTGEILSFADSLTQWLKEEWLLNPNEYVCQDKK